MGFRLLQYADIENAYDEPERIGRLAGLIHELGDDETVVCGSGDNIGPGVLSVVTQGRQALDFFEGVEADVDTFGNHDFDHGIDALLDVVKDSPQTWLCANAYRGGKRFAESEDVKPWTVIEVGRSRVGIIGVAHPETPGINPNADDVDFTDPIPEAEEGVEELRRRGVESIVVISHLGDDTELARTVDVDVVVGGHDHEKSVERIDGTLVCRPGGTGRYLLEVSVSGDRPTATHHRVDDGPIHTGVAGALRERMDEAGLTQVVGTLDEPIICDMMACKRGESRIGNLITDAYRWKTEADIGLNSGGGFRRRPPLEGEITAFDLVGVTPYATELVTLRVEGKELIETLRHLSLVEAPDDIPNWHFGHVSGAEIVWDDEADELLDARMNGEEIDTGATYEIATTEFFVANDELFPAFGPEDVVENHGIQYEAVMEYASEVGLEVELEGRIRRPNLEDENLPERNWPNTP